MLKVFHPIQRHRWSEKRVLRWKKKEKLYKKGEGPTTTYTKEDHKGEVQRSADLSIYGIRILGCSQGSRTDQAVNVFQSSLSS